jgi:hypothetical protein
MHSNLKFIKWFIPIVLIYHIYALRSKMRWSSAANAVDAARRVHALRRMSVVIRVLAGSIFA